MATMTRWDPVRELAGIQGEINRLFGRTFDSDLTEGQWTGDWVPPMDVQESSDNFTITVELPGMTSGDVDITVEDQVLTISGERKFYSEVNQDDFHRVERRFGRFHRRVALPRQCDPSKVDASMTDGLLTIEVGKVEQAKPRRIEVKA